MRIPGLKTLQRFARWSRSRPRDRALILGYHRIAECSDDPYGLCVSPDVFRRHLEDLVRIAKPVPLTHLIENLAQGRVERGAVALTFDDAYAETLDPASKILAEYGVPATAFITTSLLGRETWWDRLHRMVATPDTLPDRLHLVQDGFEVEWNRPAAGVLRDAGQPVERTDLLLQLYRGLLRLPEDERDDALETIRTWTGVAGETPLSRILSGSELVDLAASPLVEIGSHTVTHPRMADLPVEEQRQEAEASRTVLRELLQRDVRLLSYPNGSCSRDSERVVREAGYIGACASHNDVVLAGSNPYRLPRFWPSDVPDALGTPLRTWLA